MAQVHASTGYLCYQGDFSAGRQYYIDINYGTGTGNLLNHPTNSENILSRPYTILIWYKE